MSFNFRRALIVGFALFSGVVCHVMFAAGVGAMIVEMFYGMSRSLGTLPRPWGWIANFFLLIQFPVCHSFLLTHTGRSLMIQFAPLQLGGKLSTTTYATIASLQVGLLFLFWTPSGEIWIKAEGLSLILVSMAYAASWILLLKSIIDAGFSMQVGLLGWWAVVHAKSPVYPPMPRDGLFRLCRQPIYVAFVLTLWTVPVITPDQLAVAIVLSMYCFLGPRFKEARFGRLFGQEFLAYQRTVPYWLPWPRPSRRDHLP